MSIVNYVMSIPPKYKMFNDGKMEKQILRDAFNKTNFAEGGWTTSTSERTPNVFSL